MSGYWCDTCCYPVDVAEVVPDAGSEGDGHWIQGQGEEAGLSYSEIGDDELWPAAVADEGMGMCDGPVRRVG